MSAPTRKFYLLPAFALDNLVEVRNHLRLFQRLSAGGGPARPNWCFANLARDVDAILATMVAPDAPEPETKG
jgi:hypothetical protein